MGSDEVTRENNSLSAYHGHMWTQRPWQVLRSQPIAVQVIWAVLLVAISVALMGIWGLLGGIAGLLQINDGGIAMTLTMVVIIGVIPLLFAWGFYKGIAVVYTIYVTFTISQIPREFYGFSEEPVSTLLGVAFILAMVFYAAWVKWLLFPDLALVGARKIKGQYVFSN